MIIKVLEWLRRVLSKRLRSVRYVLLLSSFIFFLIPAALVLIYSYQLTAFYVWMGNIPTTFLVTGALIVTLVAIFLLIVEILFLFFYYLLNNRIYKAPPRIETSQIYVEPSPYIPYVLKPKFKNEKASVADYPLHKGRFSFGNHETNNLGFLNGPNGERDVTEKKESVYRIMCLGASTTGNYIQEDGENFSYPNELERYLTKQVNVDKDIEVINCGVGGYNSADIFVMLALRLSEVQADLIVLYHAYNDIDEYLVDKFQVDYSHSRRNFGESYWRFEMAEKIPQSPLRFVNFLIEHWFPSSPRNSLLEHIRRGEIDLGTDAAAGLKVYRRNLQLIIDLCRSRNIPIVLSTFCHFLHDEIANSPLHLRYGELVNEENKIVLALGAQNQLSVVQNHNLVPKTMDNFVDSIHFTPAGMKVLAKNFGEEIAPILLKT